MDVHAGDRHGMSEDRHLELKLMLDRRRREILDDVHDRVRDLQRNGPKATAPAILDDLESSGIDVQESIDCALIQMGAELLQKIEVALVRLEEGRYGYCLECGSEISERRLRALPFVVRCKDCEEAREFALKRELTHARRRRATARFLDLQP